MAHRYRTLQLWNQWLVQQSLGRHVLSAEENTLKQLLAKHFGAESVLIGVPEQNPLLSTTPIPSHAILSPLVGNPVHHRHVEIDLENLPIATGSIDLVLLPHTLEFVDSPRHLLREACRIVRPEGLIVICGFNPYSLWGFRKWIQPAKRVPWVQHFLPFHQIKQWLTLADFNLECHKNILYRPPFEQESLYKNFSFVELLGKTFFPIFSGVYIIVARAKVIPLTPIKLQWKQKLSGLRITTIPSHIARQTK